MKGDAAIVGACTGLLAFYGASCGFNYWLGYQSRRLEIDALQQERDGLRAQVAALQATDGDASCAVQRNGPRVLCALSATGREQRLRREVLADGDVLCRVKDRWSGRVICRLADGREVTLRRAR